jgi:hypothetical protein
MVIPPIKRHRFIWIIIKIHYLLGDDQPSCTCALQSHMQRKHRKTTVP